MPPRIWFPDPDVIPSTRRDTVAGGMNFVTPQLLHAGAAGTPWWIWVTVFLPLAVAIALVTVSWVRHRSGARPGDRLGPPNWDFSASFARL